MSTITGLKSIDIQRYTTLKILDTLGIDIREDDGRLCMEADHMQTFDMNEKPLRIDIGTPKKNVDYSVFTPLTRTDHAQYLMIMLMYVQVYDELLSFEDVAEADYSIKISTEFGDDQNCGTTEYYVAKISDGHSRVHGTGKYVTEPIAIILAILDYALRKKIIVKHVYLDLLRDIDTAYNDYLELAALTNFSRRRELRERNDLLKEKIPGEYDTDINYDVCDDYDFDDDDEDEYYEDDPDDEVDFYEEDFLEEDEIDCENSDLNWDEDDEMYVIREDSEHTPAEPVEQGILEDFGVTSVNSLIADTESEYVRKLSILDNIDAPIQTDDDVNEDLINIGNTPNLSISANLFGDFYVAGV